MDNSAILYTCVHIPFDFCRMLHYVNCYYKIGNYCTEFSIKSIQVNLVASSLCRWTSCLWEDTVQKKTKKQKTKIQTITKWLATGTSSKISCLRFSFH